MCSYIADVPFEAHTAPHLGCFPPLPTDTLTDLCHTLFPELTAEWHSHIITMTYCNKLLVALYYSIQLILASLLVHICCTWE